MSGEGQGSCALSVIVPIYNVEAYLGECLDSLVGQTDYSYEVIMVDDGSTDSSPDIAQRYDSELEHFHYFRKGNGGLGSARNYGISVSRGAYITFCDSDDVIPQRAYDKMLELAFDNDSDIVNGDVVRFNSKKTWPSSLHREVFSRVVACTTVAETPNLLFDTISCNKLYKRSFWDSSHVSFPEGVLYEDIPVVIPLLCMAKRVSMTREVVYCWRAREGADRSITQERAELRNLLDRLSALRSVDSYLESNVTEERIHSVKEWKWLNLDLPIYINACPQADETYFERLRAYAAPLYRGARPVNVKRLSPVKRMEYESICLGNRELLLRVINYGKNGYKFDKVRARRDRKGTRYFLKAPQWALRQFDEDVFDVTANLVSFDPVSVVKRVAWAGSKICVEGFCFFPKIPCVSRKSRTIRAFLCSDRAQNGVELPVRNGRAIGVRGRNELVFGIDDSGRRRFSYFNYRWSGFSLEIDPLSSSVQEMLSEDCYIVISIQQGALESSFMLKGSTKSTKVDKPKMLGSARVSLTLDSGNVLWVKRLGLESMASGAHCDDDGTLSLDLTSNTAPICVEGVEALSWEPGFERIVVRPDDVRLAGPGIYGFLCAGFPLCSKGTVETSVFYSDCGLCWRVATLGSGRIALEVFESAPFSAWGEGATLYVQGPSDLMREYLPGYLVAANKAKEVGIIYDALTAEQSDGVLRFAYDLNHPSSENSLFYGTWDLYLSSSTNLLNATTKTTAIIGTHNSSTPLGLCDDHAISLTISPSAQLCIKSTQRWGRLESTRPRRRFIESYIYPLMRLLPISRKKIMFEGLWGRKYYCNPRALYEYIDQNEPGYTCIWSLGDERRPIEGDGIRVRRLSLRYFYHLATAKYLVNNVNFHASLVKRSGQVYIETMHGMPLKTIGLDATNEFKTEADVENYKKKCAFWDYVVVQNPEVEEIARRCYAFSGSFLRTGYPRNDVLYSEEGLDKKVRDVLGVPDGKKVILYAPTWRTENVFDFHFDLDRLREELSDEYVMLLRVHPLAAKGLDYELIDNEFLFNATSYPSTEELFLASDVVISDYSSLMFDYAIVNKPILFYVYDLESYRDRLRGLYFNLEEIAPGPLVKTQDELCEWLCNYERLTYACIKSLDAFKERFCTYETGMASKKIFDQVMRGCSLG